MTATEIRLLAEIIVPLLADEMERRGMVMQAAALSASGGPVEDLCKKDEQPVSMDRIHTGNAGVSAFELRMGRKFLSRLRAKQKPTLLNEPSVQQAMSTKRGSVQPSYKRLPTAPEPKPKPPKATL